jgi:cytidylate kinase
MQPKRVSVDHIIDEQVRKWEIMRSKNRKEEKEIPVITVSREPGSGGKVIAKGLADSLGWDLFHGEIIQKMAESAQISSRVLSTLDEKGLNLLEDWISELVFEKHLWPDQYLHHLMKVIGTIREHGRAVIVGRGANFILPPEAQFRVRVVCPMKTRVENVARDFGTSKTEAEGRIIQTESDRRAFVRKYFHADVGSPINYDLTINTGSMSIDAAVQAIKGALGIATY